MSADRERFTLAHELGHLIMHDLPTPPDNAEREADAFASEFLMPAAEIGPQLAGIDLAKAANLKRHWKTAMSALIRRARDLGRIDERRYTSLNVQLSQKGWRKVEPVQIEHEQPTLIPKMIKVHHDIHDYDVAVLARLTGLSVAEYSERFGDHPSSGLRIVR
jgi:Zn-dependent peptidase ImmA (M78 family)